MTNLSIGLLRSFVAVVEMGSLQKATERIFLTQSALSQQIRRLEEIAQRPLFHRETNRRLTITPAGEQLLAYAREMLALNDRAISAVREERVAPLRVGVVQAFAESKLPDILQRFQARYSNVHLEIRVAGTKDLFKAFDDKNLDVVLGVSSESDQAGTVGQTPTFWLGDPDLAQRETVPLAVLGDGCPFRKIAFQALKRAGISYCIAAEVQDLASLHVAVQAKLAITCRPQPLSGLAGGTIIEPPMLPDLPPIHYVLQQAVDQDPAGRELVEMFRTAFRFAKPSHLLQQRTRKPARTLVNGRSRRFDDMTHDQKEMTEHRGLVS
jgi:DNA-binding transcriptional LysR family regulator